MKHLITTIVIALYLSSCLTTKKMDNIIEEYEGGLTTKLKTSDYITINTPGLLKTEAASVTAKGKDKILPLLFYWRFEWSRIPTLNSYIPIANINSTIIQYANTKKLKEKLNGQKIELTINKVPTTFSLTYRDHLAFFVLYYVQWGRVFIDPQKQDITIGYRILKDNIETKKGAITVADPSKPLDLKFLQSIKKMTGDYLELYDNMIKDMSKQFVDKLLLEI
jgi:hypothetical protein